MTKTMIFPLLLLFIGLGLYCSQGNVARPIPAQSPAAYHTAATDTPFSQYSMLPVATDTPFAQLLSYGLPGH